MKFSSASDCVGGLSFIKMIGSAARIGANGIGVNMCGWVTAPHFDLGRMPGKAVAQKALLKAVNDHGLVVTCLNANGNRSPALYSKASYPLTHPTTYPQAV